METRFSKGEPKQKVRSGSGWHFLGLCRLCNGEGHDSIFVEVFKPLTPTLFVELVSSHVYKVMQYVVAQSKEDTLSTENLKTKVTSLSGEVLNFFHKYMAKHHPGFDFSTLDMEAVEKEILVNRLSIDGVAGDVEDRMEDDTVVTTETLVDSSPSNPTQNTSFISSF
nr:hypothetical protein CFP56_18340 [Quercus suber]